MVRFGVWKGIYTMKALRLFFVVLTATLLNACATMATCPGDAHAEHAAQYDPKLNLSGSAKERYELIRKRIDTDEDYYYHEAVIEPNAFEASYPFYLLGFEKPYDRDSLKPYCRVNEMTCDTPKFDPRRFKGGPNDNPDVIANTQDNMGRNIFTDKPALVLTHILNIGKKKVGINGDNCFIFNIYGYGSEATWCKHHYQVDILQNEGLKLDWKREGWKGLEQLAAEVRERVFAEKATHIILLVAGWASHQYETYLDFRKWIHNLAEDFKQKRQAFRPIFIGTTWESEWMELIPFFSQIRKGNDADEVGLTWENYLLNDLIKPIAKSSDAQLVIIGHSFGARIALGAHYMRDLLARQEPVAEVPLTIIGMQGAFPIARLISTEDREHHYLQANKGSAIVALTSSKNDQANGKMCFTTSYVGAECGLKELRQDGAYEEFVAVLNTSKEGDPLESADTQRVSVYDVSPFVDCQLLGTGGGSHSDVYDREMAHFLGEIIRASKH